MKALYLHGFLGCPQDMEPLYLEKYDCESYDLRKILFEEDPVEFLAKEIGSYEFILGYSFGGRILEDLKVKFPEKAKKWIFVSSRHSLYPEEEKEARESFRQSLFEHLDDLPKFFDHWKTLALFSGHQMDEYRSKYKLGYTPWTVDEIEQYLDVFFTTAQYEPHKSEKSYFIHGLQDLKYSKEGERLQGIFNVLSAKGGHRFLFQDPGEFKTILAEIV